MDTVRLMATLSPGDPHFRRFARDRRLCGVRLNSAMLSAEEIDRQLSSIAADKDLIPVYFDAKGRQLRVEEAFTDPDHLELTLNHAITVETPTPVLFKAGADHALLERITDGGKRLVFRGGPKYLVRPGQSLHIRHPGLVVHEPFFTDQELEKLAIVRKHGMTRFYLSFVHDQRYIDEFLGLVGNDSEVYLKIEDKAGLVFVANGFKKRPNLKLVAARGDLYVEIDRPHEILAALRLIIDRDPEACVGSRLLLSVAQDPVPSCADFLELAWLYDIGYRTMLLCDDLCLFEPLLATAINAFDSFRNSYPPAPKPANRHFRRRWFPRKPAPFT